MVAFCARYALVPGCHVQYKQIPCDTQATIEDVKRRIMELDDIPSQAAPYVHLSVKNPYRNVQLHAGLLQSMNYKILKQRDTLTQDDILADSKKRKGTNCIHLVLHESPHELPKLAYSLDLNEHQNGGEKEETNKKTNSEETTLADAAWHVDTKIHVHVGPLPTEIGCFVEYREKDGATTRHFVTGLSSDASAMDLLDMMGPRVGVRASELRLATSVFDVDDCTLALSTIASWSAKPSTTEESFMYTVRHRDHVRGAGDPWPTMSLSKYARTGRPPRFPIIVKTLTGKDITIETTDLGTVEELKRKIYKLEGIPLDQQRLIHAGRQLEDDQTMLQYGVVAWSTIRLVLRLRGGMFHVTSGRLGYEFLSKLSSDVRVTTADGTHVLTTQVDGSMTANDLLSKISSSRSAVDALIDGMDVEMLKKYAREHLRSLAGVKRSSGEAGVARDDSDGDGRGEGAAKAAKCLGEQEACASNGATPRVEESTSLTLDDAVQTLLDRAGFCTLEEVKRVLRLEEQRRMSDEMQSKYADAEKTASDTDWMEVTNDMQTALLSEVGVPAERMAAALHLLRSAHRIWPDDAEVRSVSCWVRHNRAREGSLRAGERAPDVKLFLAPSEDDPSAPIQTTSVNEMCDGKRTLVVSGSYT